MDREKLENICHEARGKISEGANVLFEAMDLARKAEEYELAKIIDSVQRTIQEANGILIMLPRLKDSKED